MVWRLAEAYADAKDPLKAAEVARDLLDDTSSAARYIQCATYYRDGRREDLAAGTTTRWAFSTTPYDWPPTTPTCSSGSVSPSPRPTAITTP